MHPDFGGLRCRTSACSLGANVLAGCDYGVSGLGYYGTPFKAGRGVTQGGLLSAKLFNILVDAVVWEWFWQLQESGE